MNLEITENDLHNVKKILDEMNLNNHLIERSEKMPISSIVLNYISTNKSEFDIGIAFVPLPENIFSNIKILQIFYEIPGTELNLKENLSLELTNRINYLLTIGSFGLREKKITYRYCHTMPLFLNIYEKKNSIVELISMILTYIDSFEKPIIDVINGTIGIDEMINTIQE
jgi:hypothetical protein